LVASDLGESADEAIVQADAWARRLQAPLAVCHAIPDLVHIHPLLPQLAARESLEQPELQRRVSNALADRVRRLTERSPEQVRVVTEEGAPVPTILHICDELHPSLLAVGASGKAPLERALLGSTAEQLIRHAHVSVLVARRVPQGARVIVAATDFSEAAEPALVAAAEEAARRKAELALVHAIDASHPVLAAFDASAVIPAVTLDALRSASRDALATLAERFGARGGALIVEGSPAIAIAKAARDLQAELIVVGTHGRTGLRRLALGSVAAAVTRRAPCSVLVVRAG
jgi:nucleotide-binding universal stress UspA family protein